MHLLRAKLYFLFGGWCIGLSSARRSTPLGVPTDNISAGTPNGGRAYPAQRGGYHSKNHVIIQRPLPLCPVSVPPSGLAIADWPSRVL